MLYCLLLSFQNFQKDILYIKKVILYMNVLMYNLVAWSDWFMALTFVKKEKV